MTTITDDQLVISSLIANKEYFDKVIPFLNADYFHDDVNTKIFNIIKKYTKKYNEVPDYTILRNILTSSKMEGQELEHYITCVDKLEVIQDTNKTDYLVDKTEKFCRDRAVYNAIYKAYSIYDGTDKNLTIASIPDIIKDAISINFDNSFGHNYDDDADKRWDYYTSPKSKIAFEYPTLNNITGGGVTRKTLNLIAAGVNVGKTLMLIILATMYKKLGYDVLYITNEVSDMEVGKRIDASMFGVDTDKLIELGKTKFLAKVASLKEKSGGRLYIKEYETHTCDKTKIESLLQDLELHENFKPDIIINDYITINASASMPRSANMYQYYNSIAEEMRAIAQKYNLIMWSAAQLKTEAMHASDVSLSQLSDSQGIARTADLVWCVIRQEELDRLGEIAFIQLKTRYHTVKHIKWNMGIDIAKHRLKDKMKPIDGIDTVDMTKILAYNTYNNTENEFVENLEHKQNKKKINYSEAEKDNYDEFEQYLVS